MTTDGKGTSHSFTYKVFSALCALILVGILGLALSGCSGVSKSDSDANSQSNLYVGITDDEGDFLTYTLDVLSIKLTRKNGAVVDVLPVKTRVDFAEYTDMTEFLTAATVPAGEYVSASVTLDYTNADIHVEDGQGQAVQVDSILDENGSPLTTLTLDVSLEGHDSLIIAPGIPASLNLDFDLAASNAVTFSGSGAVVTVKPVLLAKVNTDIPEVHRVRGPLERDSVDVDASSFKVIVRPFIHAMTGTDRPFGVLDVSATEQTVYQIDGVSYTGRAGLEKLAAMPAYTAVIAMGNLAHNPIRFDAQEVYAGSSVPGGRLDVVWGTVIKRASNTLTLKGGTLMRAGGSVVFNDTVTVLLGDETKVTRQLSADAASISDISVGQRIHAFGSASVDGSKITVDATDGAVRMFFTTLMGTVVSKGANSLIVDLQAIDGRRVSLFDFRGTGIDSGHDADPDAYEIDVSTLDTSALKTGTPVRIRGFVSPFNTAPEDFQARTIVNVTQVPAVMHVAWIPAFSGALVDLSASGFGLDLTGVGFFHHVSRAGVMTDLKTLAKTPSVIPKTSSGLYFIADGSGELFLHTTFESFVEALDARLIGGAAVKRLITTGDFDEDSSVLEATGITIELR